MDIALKQRLVGAAVLIAGAVVFIPMILDGSADRAREGLPPIPDRPDINFETRRLPLDPNAAVSEPATAAREDTSADVTGEAAIPEVIVSAPPEDPQISDPSATVDLDPVAAGDEVVDSNAASEGGSSQLGDRSGPSGPWALQLGSFNRRENAETLVERILNFSPAYAVYAEEVAVGDGSMYRVRAGGFPTREDALDAGAHLGEVAPDVEVSLRRIGTGGTLEEDIPDIVGYMVQVGSFGNADNATALRDQLRGAGFRAHVDRIEQSGRIRHRVRVGPEIDRDDAETVRERLRVEMNLNGIVVSHP